jgi:hypothetical protein
VSSTEVQAQPVSHHLTNESMDGAQGDTEELAGAGLDTVAPTSIRFRRPTPVFSPAPLIRTLLAAVSTPAHRAEIVLTIAEVVQELAAMALTLSLDYLNYVAVYL